MKEHQPKEWKEKLFRDFVNRSDGKRPKLTPDSMWSLKLLAFIDKTVEEQKQSLLSTLKSEVEKADVFSPTLSSSQEWRLHNGEVKVPEWFTRWSERVSREALQQVIKKIEEL